MRDPASSHTRHPKENMHTESLETQEYHDINFFFRMLDDDYCPRVEQEKPLLQENERHMNANTISRGRRGGVRGLIHRLPRTPSKDDDTYRQSPPVTPRRYSLRSFPIRSSPSSSCNSRSADLTLKSYLCDSMDDDNDYSVAESALNPKRLICFADPSSSDYVGLPRVIRDKGYWFVNNKNPDESQHGIMQTVFYDSMVKDPYLPNATAL